MRRLRLLPLVLVPVLICGCSGDDEATPVTPATPGATTGTPGSDASTPSAAGPQRTAVDWKAYAPSVRRRVERFEQQKACVQLQKVRDKVSNGSLNTGTTDADAGLLAYLDEALQQSVC